MEKEVKESGYKAYEIIIDAIYYLMDISGSKRVFLENKAHTKVADLWGFELESILKSLKRKKMIDEFKSGRMPTGLYNDFLRPIDLTNGGFVDQDKVFTISIGEEFLKLREKFKKTGSEKLHNNDIDSHPIANDYYAQLKLIDNDMQVEFSIDSLDPILLRKGFRKGEIFEFAKFLFSHGSMNPLKITKGMYEKHVKKKVERTLTLLIRDCGFNGYFKDRFWTKEGSGDQYNFVSKIEANDQKELEKMAKEFQGAARRFSKQRK